MKKIYCISGLGADHRIFSQIKIDNYELVPVPWAPFRYDDSMASYALRLSGTIKEPNPVILGLSFGGMLTVEIGKIIPVKKIILVSSAKTSAELPLKGRFLATVTGLLPCSIFSIPFPFILNRFGVENEAEAALITDFIRTSDGNFMKWALRAILNWNNSIFPTNIIHIHGDADKLIPINNVKADYKLMGGGHIMVYNRALEISRIISAFLS